MYSPDRQYQISTIMQNSAIGSVCVSGRSTKINNGRSIHQRVKYMSLYMWKKLYMQLETGTDKHLKGVHSLCKVWETTQSKRFHIWKRDDPIQKAPHLEERRPNPKGSTFGRETTQSKRFHIWKRDDPIQKVPHLEERRPNPKGSTFGRETTQSKRFHIWKRDDPIQKVPHLEEEETRTTGNTGLWGLWPARYDFCLCWLTVCRAGQPAMISVCVDWQSVGLASPLWFLFVLTDSL